MASSLPRAARALSQGAWPDETLDVMDPADEILQQ
jgi:hypothetical protein